MTPSPIRRFGGRLRGLPREAESATASTVLVHHPDRHADKFRKFGLVEGRVDGEGVLHEPGEVDRSEKAGAVGRQGLLAAGVRRQMVSAYRRLFISLIRSMKITAGSA